MDKIIRRIWWIVIPTALGVLAFQLYWLQTMYVSQEKTFRQVTTDALQKAYDLTMVSSVKQLSPNNRTDTSSKMRFTSSIRISEGDKKAFDSLMHASRNQPGIKIFSKYSGATVRDDSDAYIEKEIQTDSGGPDLTRLLADVFTLSNLVETDTIKLAANYKKELLTRQITIPFHVKLLPQEKQAASIPGVITLPLVKQGKPLMIVATFDDINHLLLLKILWPIVLSFLLVVLIIGCIWTLWRIIMRQKKLEEMKNDFISNITHELKTPVAILRATNEALLSFGGMNDAEKTERYLRLGQDEIHKLQGLVDNIMSLTKLEHGSDDITTTMEVISLKALLEETMQRFTDLPGVTIHLDMQTRTDACYTSPAALKTIFANLLDNAIKYTISLEKNILITVREDDQHYIFSITDNGIGIEKKYLPYIFDKFYRVPHGNIHEVKGHGLGLSQVKQLVEKLNGSISAESTPSRGTAFTIQLNKL
ncbi:sensor histidine kinase [Chitinophaga sp. Hz27]|uniref:sensor histidine kinase n=1 Tax=Chitinophaga sp. Hz27 TaxID=3347169 RepID=UPI0035E019F8